ncbi:hypothetical protein F7725_019407 [Dissostichus mawsoni]|uniref:Uncharacterized protein n=1 Tax=Dissostichus mawsoni TaxID=36200 RepID=A0A7J5YN33_DISMA|nr:hypothetical protein F7725_019407 [Dissostichus mawsoni]
MISQRSQILTETELDHSVDAIGVGLGILQGESRREQCRFKEQDYQILHRLVILINLCLLPQGFHDGVVFFSSHVAHGGVVPESLGLHDPLHVSCPAVGACDDAAGGRHQAVGHRSFVYKSSHLLHFLLQDILHYLAQTLILSILLLLLFFSSSSSGSSRPSLVLAIKLLQLLDTVLIDGLDHVNNFEAGFAEALHKGRVGHLVFEVEGSAARNKEQSAEFQLTLYGKVLPDVLNLRFVLVLVLFFILVFFLFLFLLVLSTLIVNEPPAEDSQMYCSSSLCLVMTVTLSATRYDE